MSVMVDKYKRDKFYSRNVSLMSCFMIYHKKCHLSFILESPNFNALTFNFHSLPIIHIFIFQNNDNKISACIA